MEKVKRGVRLFLVFYGRLLLLIIGIIVLIIFAIQSLNSRVIEKNNEKYSEEEYQQEQSKKEEIQEEIKEDREYISKFIDFCNEGQIEKAYDMLSDNCKIDKYNTLQEFKEKYIDIVFKIKIYKYEIIRKDDVYINELTQDMLLTGKTDSIIETKYKIEDVLEKRIYIYY